MNFLREVFSDDDGRGSFARVATAFVVVAVLVYLGYFVFSMRAFPDATTLGALGVFMGTLYGANQMRAIFSRSAGTNPDNKDQS